jgi:hypothetical protein
MAESAARRLTVSTTLPISADRAWWALQQPALLNYVAAPLARFPQLAGRLDPWEPGERVETWVLLLGVIPFSRHHLTITKVDEDARTVQTEEGGGPIRVWEHRIAIQALGDRRCRYTDDLIIDAGRLTAVVVAFANLFYRHRQRRWRRLARTRLQPRA